MAGFSTLLLLGAVAGIGPATLQVDVAGLPPDASLPADAAYCTAGPSDPASHNISPAVSWSKGPAGTKSYVLIMTDLDVPKDLSLINKPGVTIPNDTPRVPFIHWVLTDIPPGMTALPKGADSPGFVTMGTPVGDTDHGARGANVYSFFYPKDSPLAGIRGGYDGPCPPKNDPLPHRYVTRIYALDISTLGLHGVFFGEEAIEKMKGHVLATGEMQAQYAFHSNP
jgi:Raf kinase inhibitor-like YbhB/YbcL family protein